MAASKILMKSTVNCATELSESLTRVNRELCSENEEAMFVTFFCGILNFKTGEVRYSNAGHNPPLLLRAGKKPEWLPLPPGVFLGVYEDNSYGTMTTVLNPGDILFLYTDGVTEAMNAEEEAFSDERLYSLLENRTDDSPESLVREVIRSLQDFANEAPQSDDITVLALQYMGGAK
ncbi:MAG: serine/threonine-protein phosphatase, partial [Syntrophales bacterium LBB04]|nr:serine/threonine-protein phosphatase [Syntrophales bacterium LBB04]